MALMEYNPIGKNIKTPMENTFMVESPNRKRHIFERLLFEVVIVKVKDKKYNIKHTMPIKIGVMYYMKCLKKNTLWFLFIDGVQPPQGYRTTTRRQFT